MMRTCFFRLPVVGEFFIEHDTEALDREFHLSRSKGELELQVGGWRFQNSRSHREKKHASTLLMLAIICFALYIQPGDVADAFGEVVEWLDMGGSSSP